MEELKDQQNESEINNQESEKVQEDELAYEKASYTQFSYNKVQKMRMVGRMHGVKVPYLNYNLTKPEKTRKTFITIGIIAIIAAVLVAALAVFSTIGITIPLFTSATEIAGEATPAYDYFGIVAGLKGMGIFLMVLVALMIYGFFAALLGFLIYFAKNSFNLAKATREEVAKGPTVYNIMFSCIGLVAVILAVTIFLAIKLNFSNTGSIILLVVGLLLAAGVASMLGFIIYNIVQENKWFKTLPPEQQKNYKDHAYGLRRARARKQSYDSHRSGLFGWR